MTDFAAGTAAGAPRSKVLLGGLVLVLAIVLFGAAFVYAGGVDIVQKLLGGGATTTASKSTPPATSNKPSTPAAPAAGTIPSGVMEDFGKRMYVEQVESQKNIKLLAAGDITSFSVDSVKAETDRTIVNITAYFKDGTRAPGEVVLKQDNKQYYVSAIRGLRTSATSGFADSTAMNTDKEGSLADEMSAAGIKSFDQPLLATLLSEQKSNQAIVTGIVDGTYTRCTLGAPVAGAKTITIPFELTGKQTTKAQVGLIEKTIDGKDYTFISSFKKL